LRSSDLSRAPETALGFDWFFLRQQYHARNSVKLRSELPFAGFVGLAEGITHDIQRLLATPNRPQTFRELSKKPRERKS
jgi:hypothetical protein